MNSTKITSHIIYEIYFCHDLVVNQPSSLLLKSYKEGYSTYLSRLYSNLVQYKVSCTLYDVETKEVF